MNFCTVMVISRLYKLLHYRDHPFLSQVEEGVFCQNIKLPIWSLGKYSKLTPISSLFGEEVGVIKVAAHWGIVLVHK